MQLKMHSVSFLFPFCPYIYLICIHLAFLSMYEAETLLKM